MLLILSASWDGPRRGNRECGHLGQEQPECGCPLYFGCSPSSPHADDRSERCRAAHSKRECRGMRSALSRSFSSPIALLESSTKKHSKARAESRPRPSLRRARRTTARAQRIRPRQQRISVSEPVTRQGVEAVRKTNAKINSWIQRLGVGNASALSRWISCTLPASLHQSGAPAPQKGAYAAQSPTITTYDNAGHDGRHIARVDFLVGCRSR